MPIPDRLPSIAAVLTGAGLLGAALGGVASVDSDLREATEVRAAQTRLVVRWASDDRARQGEPAQDCHERSSDTPEV